MNVESFFTEPTREPATPAQAGEHDYKAGIIFTGTGPILILTVCESFDDPQFLQKAHAKGIKKFIAYRVPTQDVKDKYGMHFQITLADRAQTDILRVVDFVGERVVINFPLEQLEEPVYCDVQCQKKAA